MYSCNRNCRGRGSALLRAGGRGRARPGGRARRPGQGRGRGRGRRAAEPSNRRGSPCSSPRSPTLSLVLLTRLRFPLGNARGGDANTNNSNLKKKKHQKNGYEIGGTVIANWSCLLLMACWAWQGKDVMVGLGKAQSAHCGAGASVAQLFSLGFLVGHWISLLLGEEEGRGTPRPTYTDTKLPGWLWLLFGSAIS